MVSREIFVIRERKRSDKWGRQKKQAKGGISLYLDDGRLLDKRRYSDLYYLRLRMKLMQKKHKEIWDRCYLIISPDIIDE